MDHSTRSLLAVALIATAVSAQSPKSLSVDGAVVRGGEGPYTVSAATVTPELKADADDATLWGAKFGANGEVELFFEGKDAAAALNIDTDGDGEVDYVASAEPKEQRTRRGNATVWQFDKALEVGVSALTPILMQAEGQATPTLQMRPTGTGYAHGTVKVGGQEVAVLVVDLDADGVLGSREDGWTVHTSADMEQLTGGERPKRFSAYSLIEAYEPCFVAGKEVHLKGVDGGAIAMTAENAGEHAFEEYLHRRNERVGKIWRDRFEGELQEMIASRGEPDRAKAEQPIEWMHTLSLEEALAKAKAEGKPLLADFETDWCIWCKVLDTLTYPDAEVAAYVRENFVPVKFNAELLVEPLTTRYEVKGFPGMPVIAPDGTKIDMLSGFQPPSKFMDSLRAARAAFESHGGR